MCTFKGVGSAPFDNFIAEQCARPAGQPISIASVDAKRAFMQGRWGLCEAPGIFGESWPGLQIEAGDRWGFLDAPDGGALTRQYGVGVQGTIYYTDTFVQFFDNVRGSTLFTPTASDNPRMLTWGNGSGSGAPVRYVALPSGTGELPDGGSDVGEGSGADASDAAADSSLPIRCHTNADCLIYETYCFIPGAGTSCPTTPIGYCLAFNGGNRLLLYGPCGGATLALPPPVPFDCSPFPNTMCGQVPTSCGDGCLTCVPAPSSP